MSLRLLHTPYDHLSQQRPQFQHRSGRHHQPLVWCVCPHVWHAGRREWLLLLQVPGSILAVPVGTHSSNLGVAAVGHAAPLLTAAAAYPVCARHEAAAQWQQ